VSGGDLGAIVVVVDTDDNAYYEHRNLGSTAMCQAFADGMAAAWKISHGYANCWRPFVLGVDWQREEWEALGSPGADKIAAAIEARGAT
jgi:hypothetical protein